MHSQQDLEPFLGLYTQHSKHPTPSNSSSNSFSSLADLAANIITAYHRLNGRNTSRGMRRMAERGEFPGRAPLGYRHRRKGHRTSIVPDPVRFSLVKEAFELAAGEASLAEIVARLTEHGLRSRSGKPLGVSALRLILTNPFYRGQIRFKGQIFQGNHRPLVEQERFEEVQKSLNRRRSKFPLMDSNG